MGKFWLFSAAIEAGYVWLAVIGVLNSAISLYYYIRVVVFMYLKKEPTGREPASSPSLALALGVAVVGDDRARRLSAAAVRGRGRVGADARRCRSFRASDKALAKCARRFHGPSFDGVYVRALREYFTRVRYTPTAD